MTFTGVINDITKIYKLVTVHIYVQMGKRKFLSM